MWRLMIVIWLTGCGVNVVTVRSSTALSTGWYDETGVVTTAHGHTGTADITSPLGFVEEDVPSREVSYDTVSYQTSFITDRCYTDVAAGDWVTVSTLRGPIRRRVVATGNDMFVIQGLLQHGDSGAPVSRGGCIAGIVKGGLVAHTLVLIYRRTK